MKLLTTLGCVLFFLACSEKSDKGGADGTSLKPGQSSLNGALQLPDSVEAANHFPASIEFIDHPELAASSDEEGKFSLENIAPGTLSILVTSAKSAGLVAGTAEYGTKIDDILVKKDEVTELGVKQLTKTGSLTGTIKFFDTTANLEKVGTDVFIPGTSFTAKTDAEGRFTLSGLPEGQYELVVKRDGFATLILSEVLVESDKSLDTGDLVLSISKGPEGSIQTLGHENIAIAGKTKRVLRDQNVGFKIHFDGEAALMKVSDEVGFISRKWEKVVEQIDWTFDSDGEKEFFVKFSDTNGLESSPYKVSFVIDTESPVLESALLVNGWSQLGTTKAFADLTGSDSGTGIAAVMISEIDSNFSSGESWVTFNPRVKFNFANSTPGPRTVYFKVKDYVGNESDVVSESINIGATTNIFADTYSEDIRLTLEQSPYLMDGIYAFAGDLTIDPGVRVNMARESDIQVKGVATLKGTSDNKIILEKVDPNQCTGENLSLRFFGGKPGVSEKNIVERTDFRSVSHIELDGGNFRNNHFDGSQCSSSRGSIVKNGEDNLNLDSNTFTQWSRGLEVNGGNSNTVIQNSSTTGVGIADFIIQNSGASGTIVKNNNVTVSNTVFEMYAGTFKPENNTITGPVSTYLSWNSPETLNISGINANFSWSTAFIYVGDGQVNISKLTATTSCTDLITIGGGSVSIVDSTLDCEEIARFQGIANMSVTISYSDIIAENDVVTASQTSGVNSVYITKSNISCVNSTGLCDFIDVWGNGSAPAISTTNLTMTDNNITCNNQSGNGCRGFLFKTWSDNTTFEGTYTVDNNFWIGKAVTVPTLLSIPTTGAYADEATEVDIANVKAFELSGGGSITANHTMVHTDTADFAISDAGPRP